MKHFLTQAAVCTAIMIGIAYFSLPSYAGKFGLSFKVGLMWGLATATVLFLAFKVIGALAAKG